MRNHAPHWARQRKPGRTAAFPGRAAAVRERGHRAARAASHGAAPASSPITAAVLRATESVPLRWPS